MARAPVDPETGVTVQQERFAAEFVKTGNLSAAYRIAYDTEKMQPASIWVASSRLMDNAKVALRIEHYRLFATKRLEVSVGRIALEAARIAFFDPRELFDDDGKPIPITELPEDVARVIGSLDVQNIEIGGKNVGRTVKYRMLNKLGALELLARWKKMLDKDAVPEADDLDGMSEEELEQEAREAVADGVKAGIIKVLPVKARPKKAA